MVEIPLAKPDVRAEDIRAVGDVLRGHRLALGSQTRCFEEAIADYVGVRHAVAVNSGTSALHLVIRASGISHGDEVITTPFSFIASTNCILYERAVPVFVDIDPTTLCMDPRGVEEAITPRTKAILAIDAFGHPADWPSLEQIADDYKLLLVEDSAEALGSEWDGRRCGSFGQAGVFGFYPNKQITTGEGGMVVTDDGKMADLCRSMANQGRSAENQWLQHVRLGYNYRMDEMSAALGLSQLARIEEIVTTRERVANWYADALSEVEGLHVPTVAPEARMSWFVHVVRLSEGVSRSERDDIVRRLAERGIECRDYFQPIHLQPYVREALGTQAGQFPITEAASARTIALPFFTRMTREQVNLVAEALAAALQERRRR